MSTFGDQSEYNKHQGCDCEDKSNCSCAKDCGCCPPGLVGYYDNQGNFSGCLTPNDAACLEVEGTVPPKGYIKVYSTGDSSGTFIGIMTVEEALAYYEGFGIITPTVAPGLFNPVTTDAISMAAAPPAGTTQEHVDFQVDRITCDNDVTITFGAGAPTGLSFFGSATSITIPSGESILTSDGIEISDAVAAATYPVEIVYTSCGTTKTRIINVTVTP